MYEARQNKEKKSRILSAPMKRVQNHILNSSIQRLVVITDDNYEEEQDRRVWVNAEHAKSFAGGPIWDLETHREPVQEDKYKKEIRFVQHGMSGCIKGGGINISAETLYDKMTHDENGREVMGQVKRVIFQSCYGAKGTIVGNDFNLTALFANKMKEDSRIKRHHKISFYGKTGVSYGFLGLGDFIDDPKYERENMVSLSEIVPSKNYPFEDTADCTAEKASLTDQASWKSVKRKLYPQNGIKKIVDTVDGGKKGWKQWKNKDNKYIRRFDLIGNDLKEIIRRRIRDRKLSFNPSDGYSYDNFKMVNRLI